MDDIVAQCPGVLAIHDDMFIYGKDDKDHDANIINLFNVAQKGLIFNSKKCAIKQESVTFFSGVFSAEGHSPDPEKIQSISEMTPPQIKTRATVLPQCSKLPGKPFIPHLSLNTEPLWALLKKKNCFAWDENSEHVLPENQVPTAESPPQTPPDTMIGANQSPFSVMPHSRGWEPASSRTDTP